MNLFSEAKKILDKDGKVNPLGPYGKQKLTGREISTYFRRNKVNDATIKKAVEVALDLGGADTIARQEIKKFYGDKVLKSKEVQNALKYANESFTYNQSLNQISEENLVEKNLMPDIQKIVDTKGAKKVGGIMVDMFTASMINQIYNKVNDQNKKKMEKSNISTLVDIAQRMMQKMGDNLGEGVFSVKLDKPYKRGDEKMYMDIIKKYGGKNLKISPPKGRDPELDIFFDGGDVKKIKSNLPNKGKGSEWISEAVSPAQQAAIAISKKEKGEKPKNEDAVAKAKLTLKHTQDMQKLKDKQAREKESMSESDMVSENSIMSVPKQNMSKIKPMLTKLANKHKKVKVSFGTHSKGKFVDDNNINFNGDKKDIDMLMKDIQKNKSLMKMMESDMQNVDDAPKDKWKALGFSQHPHKGFEDERLPQDMRDFRQKAKTPSQMRVEDAYRAMWEDGQKYAPELVEVTDKEINAMKQLSKDAEKIKKGFQKITKMGDRELQSGKYNKEYEDILKMQQSVLSLIGKLSNQKMINKESLEEKLSKADLKMIDMMYDKKGKLTDVGKAVMNYKPGDNIRKIVQNLNNKK